MRSAGEPEVGDAIGFARFVSEMDNLLAGLSRSHLLTDRPLLEQLGAGLRERPALPGERTTLAVGGLRRRPRSQPGGRNGPPEAGTASNVQRTKLRCCYWGRRPADLSKI